MAQQLRFIVSLNAVVIVPGEEHGAIAASGYVDPGHVSGRYTLERGNSDNSGEIIASTPVSGEPVAARRVTGTPPVQDTAGTHMPGTAGSSGHPVGSQGGTLGQFTPQPPQQPAYTPSAAAPMGSMPGAGQSQSGVTGAVSSAATQVSDTAGQVKDQVQDVAGQVVDQAKEQTVAHLSGQKERAVGGLDNVAHALRQTGEHLRERDQGPVSQYIEGAAGQVERFTNYLRARDVDDLIDDSERFARQQPALFLGGAFFAGLLASRFLKSSRARSERRPRPQQALPPAQYNRGYAEYRPNTGAYSGASVAGSSYTPSTSPSYRAGTEQRSTRVEDITSYPPSGQAPQYHAREEYHAEPGTQAGSFGSGTQQGTGRDLGDR